MRDRPRVQGIAAEEVRAFLADVPPFEFLAPDALAELARRVSAEYYPAGTVILRQGGPPSAHLLVIKKGGVRVYARTPEGEETLVDHRGSGDIIGFLSLSTGDRSRTTVEATHDTICYLVPGEAFRGLLEANPQIREYIHRAFLRKYLDRTLQEMRTRSLLVGGGERLLFTTPVGELASGPVATAPRGVTIREAAQAMTERRVSSLVLLGDDGAPAGILTDRDIRDKVLAAGRPFDDPAAAVMSAPIVTADARDYAFEALLAMIRHDIHHLPVTAEGRLHGIVTNHDLMVLQGTSPLSVVQEVEHQQEEAGLAQAAAKVDKVVGLLVKEGARASHVARVVTEIGDRVVRRALEVAGREAGPAPVAWAWLALGAEGRGEQVFRTGQENGLVLDDPEGGGAAAADWAERFAARAVGILAACGLPPSPQGFVASNPLWRRPLRAWERQFAEFVAEPGRPRPAGHMGFFDFRVVAGDTALGERLRDHVAARVAASRTFLPQLAGRVAANRPPLGFFGSLLVEKGGEHKDQLNLKARGTDPLVNLVRFFALEAGLRETGTVERIEALRRGHGIVGEYADELLQAFEFLSLLGIHNQFRRLSAGEPPDSFVDPERLTPLERRTAKDAFQLVARVQGEVVRRQKPAIYE